MSNIVATYFGDAPSNVVQSVADMQAESDTLYAAEEKAIQQDITVTASVNALRAARKARIARQVRYVAMGATGEAITALEALPTDDQKMAALDYVSNLIRYRNVGQELVAYANEEQALDAAKKQGQTVYLNTLFAVQRARSARDMQASTIKNIEAQQIATNTTKVQAMLVSTAQSQATRDSKLADFVLNVLGGETKNTSMGVYVTSATVSSLYKTQKTVPTAASFKAFLPPYIASMPSLSISGPVKTTTSLYSGTGTTYVSVPTYTFTGTWKTTDLLEKAKQIVLNNPHDFLNTNNRLIPAVFSRQEVLDLTTTSTGPANFNYLIKAILDECFPFYADANSGVKDYPYFIDYAETTPWPSADQFLAGIYKILRVGTIQYGQGTLNYLKKLSDANTSTTSSTNYLFNPPINLKYSSPRIMGSNQPYPIVRKENPAYKPWKIWQYAYPFSADEALIFYNEWVVPFKYYQPNNITSAERSAVTTAFSKKYPAIWAKYTTENSSGGGITKFVNKDRSGDWKTLDKGGDVYADAFEELGPNQMDSFFAIRPTPGYAYIPRVGHINPVMMLSIPMLAVDSPMALETQRRALANSKIAAMNKFLHDPIGTVVTDLRNELGQSGFGRYILSTFDSNVGIMMFFGHLMQGQHVTSDDWKAALGLALKAAALVATGSAYGAAIALTTQEIAKTSLGETEFGRALITIGTAVAVAGATGASLAQALTQSAENEAQEQIVRTAVKSTNLGDSLIGQVAMQIVVQTGFNASLQRDWTAALVDSSKKGAMKLAASQVPGGQYLVQAAIDVFNEGWDAILPTTDTMKLIENPAAAIAGIDFKKIGDNIAKSLTVKQNQQILALLATGKMSGEQLAKNVIEQKLVDDLKTKIATTQYDRDPNDPQVQAAAKLTQEIFLMRKRTESIDKLVKGGNLSRVDLVLLNPVVQYYWDIVKQVVPGAQVNDAMKIGLNLGMPDIKDYLGLKDMNLSINLPFSIPKSSIMDLDIHLPSLPNVGPDTIKLTDLPKLNANLDMSELEKIVKAIMPKNVKLEPVVAGGVVNYYNVLGPNGTVTVRPKLEPSQYEHAMLSYNYVPRHLTPAQQAYNLVRELEIKQAILEDKKIEDAADASTTA